VFEQDWTASNDGTYDFWVDMYDGDGNQEDDFWIYNVSLESYGGGGGNGSDDDEWFYNWDYDVNPSDTIIEPFVIIASVASTTTI
jgi:hypothetical protein